jgi:hypothetical protein
MICGRLLTISFGRTIRSSLTVGAVTAQGFLGAMVSIFKISFSAKSTVPVKRRNENVIKTPGQLSLSR